MSLHSDVEALARALGVWHDARRAAEPGRWTLSHSDGSFLLRQWEAAGGGMSRAKGVEVDPPTAAIILLGHARGLRVDVGECSACRERGSNIGLAMWEWMQRQRGYQFPLTWPDEVGEWQMADVPDRWPGRRVVEYRNDWEVISRPCPLCSIDGQPTGRHMLAWERAILDAMPKRAEVSPVAGEWGPIGQAMEAAKPGPFESPGDPATRTALTVLADQAQARGDKLGDALAWWLAEPDVLMQHEAELRSIVQAAVMRCPACGGDGHYHPMPLDGMQASDSRDEALSCTRCGGLGMVIRRQGSERVDHQAAAV